MPTLSLSNWNSVFDDWERCLNEVHICIGTMFKRKYRKLKRSLSEMERKTHSYITPMLFKKGYEYPKDFVEVSTLSKWKGGGYYIKECIRNKLLCLFKWW